MSTRGDEAVAGLGVPPSVTPFTLEVAEAVRGGCAAQTEGVRVRVPPALGLHATAGPTMPWLLGGVKSTSYAVNLASLRWAAREGADDVLWVSSDGYALEAPTASLVWLVDDTLWTVPPAQTGILAGTTARWLLDHAGELGYRSGERLVRPAELMSAEGVWLTSSVRGVVPVRELDGAALPLHPRTTALRELMGFPS